MLYVFRLPTILANQTKVELDISKQTSVIKNSFGQKFGLSHIDDKKVYIQQNFVGVGVCVLMMNLYLANTLQQKMETLQ